MPDNTKKNEIATTSTTSIDDTKKNEGIGIGNVTITGESLQRYVLGYKRSGQPRAIYDVFKDFMYEPKKKSGKKKKKNKDMSGKDIYRLLNKTRKKSKKNKNHWKF